MKDFTRLDNLINGFVEKGSVPGCSVAIMQNDELLYHKEAGFMDLEARTPVTPDSMFAQASMTKLFAYVIMAMLYEEGKSSSPIPCTTICPSGKTQRNMFHSPTDRSSPSLWIIPSRSEMPSR